MLDICSIDDLAVALRQLRKEARLTQAQLATAAGLSRQRLVAIETGHADNIELSTFIRILDALGMQLSVHRGSRPNLNEILRDNQLRAERFDHGHT